VQVYPVKNMRGAFFLEHRFGFTIPKLGIIPYDKK